MNAIKHMFSVSSVTNRWLYKILLSLFLCVIFNIPGKSQDPEYSQFYANPLYLNPALAGSDEYKRMVISYRNQWPTLDKGFVTYNGSYDQYVKKIHGGVGVLFNADVAGDGLLTTTQASLIYAFSIQISYELFINMAVEAGFLQRSLDWTMLRFGDQIDLHNNRTLATAETPPEHTSVIVPDFAAGAVFGWRSSLYGGIAFHHLLEPNLSHFSMYENKLPIKFTAHMGGNINLEGGSMFFDPKFYISPNVLYQQQGQFHQLNAGVYITYRPLVLGTWYRHNFENPDAVILMVGIEYKTLRIGYSYDITISGLNTGGAHEISVSIQFTYKQFKRTIYPLRTPGF